MKPICLIFHAVTLLHHLIAGKYTTDYIDYSKTSDPEVLKIKEFEFRFFTTWNLIFQVAYFTLALIHDILQDSESSLEKWAKPIEKVKGYIFTTLVFPGTVFVVVMFWSVFAINREWILPAAADSVIPKWINHAMHTNILFVLIIETLLVNQKLPTFKAALIGLSVCTVLYDTLFFITYFQSGRWLYGLFYVFTWTERAAFTLFNYFLSICLLRVGITIQSLKGESEIFSALKTKLR